MPIIPDAPPPDLLERVAADLRRLTSGLGVEIAIVVPVHGTVVAEPVIVAVGTADRIDLIVPLVLRPALVCGATALVLAHNHPARRAVSPADRAFTRRLVAASAVVGISVHGHLVLLPDGWANCLSGNGVVQPYPVTELA